MPLYNRKVYMKSKSLYEMSLSNRKVYTKSIYLIESPYLIEKSIGNVSI